MRSGALRIAIIYVVVAFIWITLSDRVLYAFQSVLSAQLYLVIGSVKGYVFVIINGFLLYKLINDDKKKLIESTKESIRADDEIKRLGKIITKVNNMVIITDCNNFITWVNKAFEDFSGYHFDEVAGYAPATFFAGGETDTEVLGSIIKKKKAMEPFSAEVNCHKKNGEKFWVNCEYTPLFNSKNEFTGYIAVYNDITWLKHKEKETVRQNDKLREIAWLSSHQIRRPLANIIGLINLMNETSCADEKNKILDSINKSARELDEMVNTINATIGVELENADANIK